LPPESLVDRFILVPRQQMHADRRPAVPVPAREEVPAPRAERDDIPVGGFALHRRDRAREDPRMLPQDRLLPALVDDCDRFAHRLCPIRSSSSSSCSRGMPSCCAFWSLLPGSAPTTTYDVRWLTLLVTRPPCSVISASASARVSVGSVPVSTKVIPASASDTGCAAGSCSSRTPARRNFSIRARLRSSPNHSTIALAICGPSPLICSSSACDARAIASTER